MAISDICLISSLFSLTSSFSSVPCIICSSFFLKFEINFDFNSSLLPLTLFMKKVYSVFDFIFIESWEIYWTGNSEVFDISFILSRSDWKSWTVIKLFELLFISFSLYARFSGLKFRFFSFLKMGNVIVYATNHQNNFLVRALK